MFSSNIAVIQTLCKILLVNNVIRVYWDKCGAWRNRRSKYVYVMAFVTHHHQFIKSHDKRTCLHEYKQYEHDTMYEI